jgi:membrane-associated phospholipid phosphatase
MLLLTTALAIALSGSAQAELTATPAVLQNAGVPADPEQQHTPPDRREQNTEQREQNTPPDPQDQKADAKEPPTPPHTGIKALFGNLVEDIKHLPEMQNVYIAGAGGALALAVHPVDQTFNERLMSTSDFVNAFFAPGKYLGDTPEQVAFSIGTYVVGRLRDQPKVAHLGMDLVQAQLMSELLVEPLKFATQRPRPDGSNNLSFPSGHASVTFATATVIERHLGWRKSVLGYAIATYVAMSRMHDNRHYLSDVVFGAATGTIAGRTVVHHHADYWAVTPVAVPGGGVAVMVSRTRWNP